MPRDNATAGEIAQLTGLRGIAAFDVMLSHFNSGGYRLIQAVQFNNQAVDLFFCLSAFILCVVYGAGVRPSLPPRRFISARIARIYPLYLVSIILMGAVFVRHFSGDFAFYPHGRLFADCVRQALMVNAWPIVGDGVHWNVVAWSVSIEVLCYIAVFPPLFLLARRCGAVHWTFRLGVMLVVGYLGGRYGYLWFDATVATYSNPPAASPLAYWAPALRGAAMFVTGWLAYLSWQCRDRIARTACAATDLIALATIGLLVAGSTGSVGSNAALMLFPLLILGLMSGRSATARLLASPPLRFLGVISYSIYLLHMPVLFGFVVLVPDLGPETLIVASVVATLVVASAAYYGFEEPSRRVLRRWLGGPAPPSAALAASTRPAIIR